LKVTENPEQGARLEMIIDALSETQTSVAQLLGISQGYVSQMVGGSRNISRRVLHFITKNYPSVNINWLLTGEGEMFLHRSDPPPVGVMEPVAVYERLGQSGLLESLIRRVEELERWRKDVEGGEDVKE
jgi:transcriptional regulator with XRE-family HTH domain